MAARGSVVVVGGGIAGLAAAWELSGGVEGPTTRTPRVEVLEASERFGGSLAQASFGGRTIDLGGDGFLARRPEAEMLAVELGLSLKLEPIAASGASLFSRGALHELPTGLNLGVPTDLKALLAFKGISWRARLAARRDTSLPRRLRVSDDASIGEIVRAKLGRELSYHFVEPMIGGIQAGRIDDLSAKTVFPALLDAARAGGSLMRALQTTPSTSLGPRASSSPNSVAFYTLKDGVGSLVAELCRQLDDRGVVLRSGAAVTALRPTPAGLYPWEVDTTTTTTPANAIVFATPAPAVGALVGSHDLALEALRGVDSASAAILTFTFPTSEITLPEHGTGVLVPLKTSWSGEGTLMTTALTFLDRKWPHLKSEDDYLLRAHVGRSDDSRWSELTDVELLARVASELAFLLPRCGTPSASLVQRWPNGLPQYRVGHEGLVQRARAAAAPLKIALAGNAYDGVGIPASIGSGRRAARETLEHFRVS